MFESCRSCPGFVPESATSCPHCGARVAAPAGLLSRAASTAAKLGAAGAMMVTLMACYGGGADDGPFVECFEDSDCFEGTCDGSGFCVPGENCFNGFDDDGDGLTDLDDDDCANVIFEANCSDGLDDDEDGFTDCADPDCYGLAVCAEDCGNGIDDDADGLVDCEDTDSCAPCPGIETHCGNLFDDDQDGLVDCDDPDCAAVCAPPVCGDGLVAESEECDDGNTVDGDGCGALCALEVEAFCANVPQLSLGSNPGDNDGATNAFSASCVAPGGQEIVRRFTAAAAGTLYLALQADHDMGVYVTESCATDALELACANVQTGGLLETTSVALSAGQSVFVIADGAGAGPGGPFSLEATFVEE